MLLPRNAPDTGALENESSISPGSASPRPTCQPCCGHTVSVKRAKSPSVPGTANMARFGTVGPVEGASKVANVPAGITRSAGIHVGEAMAAGTEVQVPAAAGEGAGAGVVTVVGAAVVDGAGALDGASRAGAVTGVAVMVGRGAEVVAVTAGAAGVGAD